MDKFKVALITLLVATLAMIGVMMYCEGEINWMLSHYGRQDHTFVDFPDYTPYRLHFLFLEHVWIGFAVLSVLWTLLGVAWLRFKEPKFKAIAIVPTAATLAYLSVETYYHYSAGAIRNPYLT